ncbi:MAG: bifunctional methylenetetrahydrofolate dehydrogenase/methenyltetrahydrofolate cyclohydrolase FolD [Planctomycetota bacterium]|nr:bifunctional methylenetetrahydrofolate dehydrogenase/methenyltetrahydrofolate cyclohydrolase FolD [Planctomycetota bacterium]MCX8039496.1 bifunctional methylenetetrahydrofolate dehydrogenase/methenyltetrahydrofolate cyclohydrolase FolD [Planctomycetota bacterium]MDW8373014.1 bifunctional methylenetetrahydrofolate dehydrogenase/methenyltetrahydrofolate cyclohydrolase FolD [Planctomycetota bacterium]
MAARILDGRRVADQILAEVAAGARRLESEHGVRPGIAVILVGDDPASQVYVANKERTATALGFLSRKLVLPASTTQEALLSLLGELNRERAIHGILVQSPLPRHIDERAVVLAIDPAKDVDGFHPLNVGKLLIGERDGFLPCTPWGVVELLARSGFDPAGRHAVIVGRSNIVGKPLAALLMQKAPGADATVTVCHSRTHDLAAHTQRADLLIAALGRPRAITAEMVKPGAVVVDVGINRVPDPAAKGGQRLVGDVDFAAVAEVASAITPVPGGVGPMTIAMLMRNTLRAARRAAGLPADEAP